METLCRTTEIVSYNCEVRGLRIGVTPQLIHSIMYKNSDTEIGKIISSKGINRLKGLDLFLSGINCISSKKIDWYEKIDPKYKVLLTACFIINAQVFSDGNHRTAYTVLIKSRFFKETVIIKIIEQIKNARNIFITDYSVINSSYKNLSFKDFIDRMPEIYASILLPFMNLS